MEQSLILNLSQLKELYIGKTPKVSENNPSHVIGIIDCSGSMSSHFEMLCEAWNDLVKTLKPDDVTTVLFSCEAKIKEGNLLVTEDCNGSTNILSGFALALEEIEKLNTKGKDDFMILFISDGEDNNSNTISERIKVMKTALNVGIKLICVGVGTNFPTFVSMELRLKYHNSSPSIPPVFLVFTDYDWETKQNEFVKSFTDIKQKYLGRYEEFEISPAVHRFPWDQSEEKQKVKFEESNFYVSTNPQNVYKNEFIIENKKIADLNEGEILDLFKTWLQTLLLESMDKSVKKEAEIFYDLAAPMFEQLKSPFESKFKNKAITLKDRLEIKNIKTKFADFDNIIAELKRLKLGVSLKELTQDEAAKRLAIGTKQGKFHNKALQMRGVTQEDFDKYKKEFLEILEKTKFTKNSNQENSFTILQNQKDVLSDPDLAESLKNASLYEILDVIPLVGQTCMILISDSSMINPFNVDVVYIPKINKTCDTYTLVENHNQMEIPIGAGQKENFNAVIPLFDESDSELGPLVRSSLFHLMMTFNCMRNLDTFFPEAYLALLSNFLVKLLKEPESQWRQDTIDKVVYTAELVYGKSKLINKTIELLQGENPRLALITEKTELEHKCENVSKVVLALMIMKKRNLISDDKIPKLIEYMIIEATGRQIKNIKLNDLFEIYDGEEISEDYEQPINTKKLQTQTNEQNPESVSDPNENQDSEEMDIIDSANDNDQNSVPKHHFKLHKQKQKLTTKEKNDGISLSAKSTLKEEEVKKKFLGEFLQEQKIEKIEDIKTLRLLFKTFFGSNYSLEQLKTQNRLKLNQKVLNKIAMKFNSAFWYKLQAYLCGAEKKINNEIFWVAVFHCVKNTSSSDRNEKDINYNYTEIKQRQTDEFLNANLKKLIDSTFDKTLESLYADHLADFKNSVKLVKDLNCTTDLLKNKAAFNENAKRKNVMFLGLKGAGKSSLVGKLMHDLNLLDEEMFKLYKVGYQTIFPQKENYPYEWVANTDADERSTGLTLHTNISHINYGEDYIKIYDTPGKFQHFRNSLKDLNLIDTFFLCLEAKSDSVDDINNSNFIANLLKILSCGEKIKSINILITKIDNESNEENLSLIIEKINNKLVDILSKNQLDNLAFNITPVSSHKDFNITKLNKNFINLKEKNIPISEKSLLELLQNQEESFRNHRKIDGLELNSDTNRFEFSFKNKEDIDMNQVANSKSSFKAILLTRRLNKNKLEKKLVYATVVSGCLEPSDHLLILPNLNYTAIDSLKVNFNSIAKADRNHEITILLKNNIEELEMEEERNIIYAFADQTKLNEYRNNLVHSKLNNDEKTQSIHSVEAEFDYLGNSNLKVFSRINVDYKGFSFCFYIDSFEKISLESNPNEKKEEFLVKGNKYKVVLKPDTDTYFENIYWNHKDDSSFVVRGKYYSIDAFGNFIQINSN